MCPSLGIYKWDGVLLTGSPFPRKEKELKNEGNFLGEHTNEDKFLFFFFFFLHFREFVFKLFDIISITCK